MEVPDSVKKELMEVIAKNPEITSKEIPIDLICYNLFAHEPYLKDKQATKQWLEKHDLDVFEIIKEIGLKEFNKRHFIRTLDWRIINSYICEISEVLVNRYLYQKEKEKELQQRIKVLNG